MRGWRTMGLAAVVAVVVAGCTETMVRDVDHGVGGIGELDPVLYHLERNAFEVADDGSVILAATGGGTARIVRLGPDGRADGAFTAHAPTPVTSVGGLAVDADGRILTAEDTEQAVIVRRLLPDGTPDPAFGGDGEVVVANENRGGTVDVQVDAVGRPVVLFERATLSDLAGHCVVTRLTEAGAPDPTFAGGAGVVLDLPYSPGVGAQCLEAVVLPDGGVLAADVQGGVARLDATGALDPTYGTGALTFRTSSRGLRDVALLPNGRLALGATTNVDPNRSQLKVGVLLPDGELDPAFSDDGVDIITFYDLDPLWSPGMGGRYDHTVLGWLAPTPAGDLVAVGSLSTEGLGITRWRNGQRDDSFGTGGRHIVHDDDLPSPHVLDHPITGEFDAEGAIHTVSNRQGALAPLTLVRLEPNLPDPAP